MRKAALIVWKDLLVEARGPERVPTIAMFSAAVLLTLHFGLAPDSPARAQAAGGFLWASILFAGVLELRRAFESERGEGTLDGLRGAPLDPAVLFAAKVASGLAVLVVLEAVLVPLTALFFGGRMSGVPAAFGVTVLGSVGLLSWGLLLAGVSGASRSSEVLLPILLFPLLVPQTIAVVRLLSHHLAGVTLQDPATGFVILAGFDLLSVGTSILLFGYVLEE